MKLAFVPRPFNYLLTEKKCTVLTLFEKTNKTKQKTVALRLELHICGSGVILHETTRGQ